VEESENKSEREREKGWEICMLGIVIFSDYESNSTVYSTISSITQKMLYSLYFSISRERDRGKEKWRVWEMKGERDGVLKSESLNVKMRMSAK